MHALCFFCRCSTRRDIIAASVEIFVDGFENSYVHGLLKIDFSLVLKYTALGIEIKQTLNSYKFHLQFTMDYSYGLLLTI